MPRPRRLVLDLTWLPRSPDAVVVADGGDIVGTFAYNAWPRGPRKWLDPGPYGTLGVGGGFALGASTAFPKTVGAAAALQSA